MISVYFRWIGGKSKLVKLILRLIPKHKTYVEPFIGAGWVFWSKTPSEVEVINDLDGRLIKFYEGLREIDDLKKVIDKYGWAYRKDEQEVRAMFDRAKKIIERPNHDIDEFVWAFLFVNKFSYAGRMFNSTFNPRRFKDCIRPYCGITTLLKDFHKINKRLKNTVIMNEDWSVPTKQYDSADTFFYFDPPYVGTSDDSFTDSDYKTRSKAPSPKGIFKILSGLNGKFILSYDDHPSVLKYIDKYGFYSMFVELDYEVRKIDRNKKVREVIVSNFDLKKQKSLLDFLT